MCREQHEAAKFEKLKKSINRKWVGNNKKASSIKFKDQEYLIEEITNGYDLYKESDTMKHCVFSYVNRCAGGETSIWSIKKKVHSIYQSYLTIEVKGDEIWQIAGKRNKEPDKSDLELVNLWAKENRLTNNNFNQYQNIMVVANEPEHFDVVQDV